MALAIFVDAHAVAGDEIRGEAQRDEAAGKGEQRVHGRVGRGGTGVADPDGLPVGDGPGDGGARGGDDREGREPLELLDEETVVLVVSDHGARKLDGGFCVNEWLIRDLPKSFAVFSGDDPTAVALMLCGGAGNISVTANVAPRQMHELCVAAMKGDIATAMKIQFQLMPVHKNLFVEANPIPVKWAMARMGLCGHALRLPLTQLSPSQQPVVETALKSSGLL